ncbi:hypothetical protein [Halomonas campaniensis]|uniref:Uncharacterized protein n=1 Tax=Halomonas campaniensis TaxID=213554 RepID=A0A246S3G3_9GAMM|nr:hypothetical protein [Halomonas campaniensis]OWV30390.1 hypothetical protein JI62_06880 [Halomonas campaniensis]
MTLKTSATEDTSSRRMVVALAPAALMVAPFIAGQLIEAQSHYTGRLLITALFGLLSLILILISSGTSTMLRGARTAPSQGVNS